MSKYRHEIMKWLRDIFLCVEFLNFAHGLGLYKANKACKDSLPLHATRLNYTLDSCTWQCHNGYYLSSSTENLPTCRQCTIPNRKCAIGFYLKNCSENKNFECDRCPMLNFAQEYL